MKRGFGKTIELNTHTVIVEIPFDDRARESFDDLANAAAPRREDLDRTVTARRHDVGGTARESRFRAARNRRSTTISPFATFTMERAQLCNPL